MPSHFHARYGSQAAAIGIDPIKVLAGDLERRALSMVFEWAAQHQRELLANWDLLEADNLPDRIAPLDEWERRWRQM
jgi:Domain of unknown function (DUF4160)